MEFFEIDFSTALSAGVPEGTTVHYDYTWADNSHGCGQTLGGDYLFAAASGTCTVVGSQATRTNKGINANINLKRPTAITKFNPVVNTSRLRLIK